MISTERLIRREDILCGKVLHVTKDTVLVNEDREAEREVAWHPGASAVIPVTAEGNIVLVRQYRYALGKAILEIPAGKLEKGEDPAVCAKRELEEEAGICCDTLEPLGYVYTSPGFSDEVIYLYLGRETGTTAQRWDDDEFKDVETYAPETIYAMIDSGELSDAKSIAAFCRARQILLK